VPGEWIIAAIDASRVHIMDSDLSQAAAIARDPVWQERLTRAASATLPASDYRLGQFRRPAALVRGRIEASALSRLSQPPAITNEEAYERQLRQALRALIGAPADAPLAALVASAVARGRARLIAMLDSNPTVYVYAVDEGTWFFSVVFEHNNDA
jgi:hypothetical protein